MTELAQAQGQRRTVSVGGLALAYTEYAGEGPPLVLLHGIGSRDTSWQPAIAGLTPWFHLYVLDLRGHGASAKPDAGYDVADYADDLDAVLNVLAIQRPRIMGHSLGALVTIAWAARYPNRAPALVLEDPPLRVLPGVLDLFDDWMRLATLPVDEAAAVYRERFPAWTEDDCRWRAESITGTAPGVFREGKDRFARLLAEHGEHLPPLSGDLPPTLLIYGDVEAGGMVAAADVEHFTASVPRGVAARVAGAGHSVHRDQPEAFLALVIPFLRRAVPAADEEGRDEDGPQATAAG